MRRTVLAIVAALGCVSMAQAEVTIETVIVGNPGNAGELSGSRICGAVDYVYSIGKFEVTAGQYTEFLNAVAATDTYDLYNIEMVLSDYGCQIVQTGASPDYIYSVNAEWADRPVNYVSWGDAARFANWLHNGQPTGAQNLTTTEDGSYFLDGAMSRAELIAITREPDATWAIPSEDEWYKAAYHYNDGMTGNYWDYPTGSNTLPTSEPPAGTDMMNGSANYPTEQGGYVIGSPYYRTEVGAYDAKPSDSPYGTFDQGGNVWEWNEASIWSWYRNWVRGLRGGSFFLSDHAHMHAGYRADDYAPTYEHLSIGFRVAVGSSAHCGDGVFDFGEQCDGANDANCPGRCVPPGATGPDGERECTCIIDGEFCEEAIPLPNGTSEYFSPGGWWTFTADSPRTAINFCGTSDYDSAFYVWTGTCNTLEFVWVNDDSGWRDGYYGFSGDPLSSCFPFPDTGDTREASICVHTTPGQRYWAYDLRVELRDTAVITKSKRLECWAIWEQGACCDGSGKCTDDVAEVDCQDRGDVWSAQKLCSTVEPCNRACCDGYGNCGDDVAEVDCQDPGDVWTGHEFCTTVEPCDVTFGTCCDHGPGLGGACLDTVESESCTVANQEFKVGEYCGDTPCLEVRGACCNGFTGDCAQTIRGDCRSLNDGRNMVWTQETPCAQAECSPIPGACCDHVNPDPLARVGVCTHGVLMVDCQGENYTWTKARDCAAVDCVAVFQAIPTVSEWGFAVLALALLVVMKLTFGRQRKACEDNGG